MINNAIITSTQAPAAPDAFGKPSWETAVGMEVPCLVDEVSLEQRVALQSVLRDSTHKVMVEPQGAFNPFAVKVGWVLVLVDNVGTPTFFARVIVEHSKQTREGLPHCEFYCREILGDVATRLGLDGGAP